MHALPRATSLCCGNSAACLAFFVHARPTGPGLVHVSGVATAHDPEQQLGRLVARPGASLWADEGLVPAHGVLAGVPIEGNEIGLLALVEVAQHVVEVQGAG